jgi:hypothetical protein
VERKGRWVELNANFCFDTDQDEAVAAKSTAALTTATKAAARARLTL